MSDDSVSMLSAKRIAGLPGEFATDPVAEQIFQRGVYPLSDGGASINRLRQGSRAKPHGSTEVIFGNMQVEIVAVTILGETEAMVRRDDEIPIF